MHTLYLWCTRYWIIYLGVRTDGHILIGLTRHCLYRLMNPKQQKSECIITCQRIAHIKPFISVSTFRPEVTIRG